MKDIIFKGITTALVTPFDREGNIDVPGLRTLIDHQIENNIDAIALVGGSGEAVNLSPSEQERVIHHGVEHAARRIKIIAGILAPDTGSAITLAKQASQAGVDALLVLTPFYNRPSKAGVVQHFRTVADATDTPVIVYNNPGRTGISLDIDDYHSLAEGNQFVGVKECNRDLANFSQMIAELGSKWAILSGEDDLLYPSLALGAAGGIITTGNIVPRIWADMYSAVMQGNYEKARTAHYAVLPLIRAVYTLNHPALVKEAIHALDLPGGKTRAPLLHPTPEQCRLIHDVLNNMQSHTV